MTSRGRVTIPAAIRERAGLSTDTAVDFELDGDAVRIVPARRGSRLIAHLRGRGDVSMTTDEIIALMRGDDEAPS
ncbi:AbrB/MazE/SpoVT family DNA-binding domain-containing protein [Phenylobacterium sp.]|uniref:AbrB/MazE/SpoVT family DNA-binding domain-containing protein n=1 Tax=Phenylobacterium sp. TaxID=1871053 RepID=UPI00345DFEE9